MRRSVVWLPLVLAIAAAALSSPVQGQVQLPSGFLRSAEAIPNRYIVVLKETEQSPNLLAGSAATMVAASHAVQPDHVYTHALNGFAFAGTEQQALRMAADPAVAYVQEDGISRAFATQFGGSWGLDRIDQPDLPRNAQYRHSTSFKAVPVFVLDSGVNPNHPDFFKNGFSRVAVAADFTGGNGLDCNGHGTHVASTIGGAFAGVVKWVAINSVRVLGCDGRGATSGIIAGIDYVTRSTAGGRSVMNLSLGGPPNQAEDDAIRRAIASGVVAVVAAGNDGQDARNVSPARVAEAITVGGTNENDGRYSLGTGVSNYGPEIDILAPGQQILGARHLPDQDNNYGYVAFSGTSMAAPHVAGAAVLYLDGHPNATPQEVRDWLVNHAAVDRISGFPAGTPNRLLQVQDINAAAPGLVSVPRVMHPGRQYMATVTFANTGNTTWATSQTFRLGSANPHNNSTWGTGRVDLPTFTECCESGFFNVPTGREAVFNFPVTAPMTPGTYNFQWQMVQDNAEWFGTPTTNIPIQVAALTEDAVHYATNVAPKMQMGKTYRVSVSYTNVGTTSMRGYDYALQPIHPVWGVSEASSTQAEVRPNEQLVFNFTVRAWNTMDPQPFQWRLVKRSTNTPIGDASPRKDVYIRLDWFDDAEVIGARVPTRMRPGATYDVSVTYRNRGSGVWTDSQPYWLGIRQNGRFFTFNHPLPVPEVRPGQQVTFTFPVTAPVNSGVDHLQWQMVNAGDAGFGSSEWFGDMTQDFAVHVAGWTDDAEFVGYDVPSVIAPGATVTAMVTFRNTGTNTWTKSWPYWLATLEGSYDFWSFNTPIPVTSVGPGSTVTVPVTLKAPTTLGTYLLSWQMVDAGPSIVTEPSRYFGEISPPIVVTVQEPATPQPSVCEFTVSPGSDSIASAGGTRSIAVDAAASCAWMTSSETPWLTISPGSIGAGSATYAATANPSAQARTGMLMIAGTRVSVMQPGNGSQPPADFDANGLGDLFLYNAATGAWSMQGARPGAFEQLGAGMWAAGWTILPARFNRDSLTDLLLYNAGTGQWLKATNLGGGSFSFYGYRWAAGWTPFIVDFDGDGLSDLFLYNRATGTWFRARTMPDAADFVYTAGVWAPGWRIAPADFDGDGRADLFLYNNNPATDPNSGKWLRVLTAADGTFLYDAGPVRWAANWQITVADFDGDGRSDLFLYGPSGQWFRVTFGPAGAVYTPGTWAAGWSIQPADFNADRRSDLFLYNPTTGRYFVVLSDPELGFTYVGGAWAANWSVQPSELNGDDRSDLLLYNPSTGVWFHATTVSPGVFSYATGAMGTGFAPVVTTTTMK